jgi:nitrite reductase/ring-hydroxylating ferredoxin subunit
MVVPRQGRRERSYHGWRFDLGTGACLFGDEPARRYEVELAGDELRIHLG